MSFFKSSRLLLASLLLLFSFSILATFISAIAAPTRAAAQEEPPAEEENNGQTDSESCESNGGEFSFFVCPLLRVANNGVELFDSEVRKRVQVDPDFYNANESGVNPLKEVWGRLRNVAFILLIPIALMLVIGTALGFSFLDAYTVKRAMPRLLFAVVFMAISFDIGALMIDISNAASRGIQGILVSAVGGPEKIALDSLFNSNGLADGVLLPGSLVAGAVAIGVGVLSISILASLMLSAAMGLFVIFFILLARQLIIVAILAILPLAILTWIFPGNDKFWKLTWNTFTGLLIAGPAFAGFVVLGRILAFIVESATGDADPGGLEMVMLIGVKLGLILMSMFGGTVAITRFAGAAGNILGAVNDRSKGLFDRNKNFRSEKRKALGERAAAGNRFNSTNRVLNPISRRTSGWAQRRKLMGAAGFSLMPGTRRARIQNAVDVANEGNMQKQLKENELLSAFSGDDDVMRIARQYRNNGNKTEFDNALRALGPRFANEDVRRRTIEMVDQTRKSMSDATFDRVITNQMPGTGTGYNTQVVNPETGEVEQITDYSQFAEDIANSYGNSIFMGAKVGSLRSQLADSGHMAGKMSFGTAMGATTAMQQGRQWVDSEGNLYATEDAAQRAVRESGGQLTYARETPEALRERVRNDIIGNAIDSVPKSHLAHGKPYATGQSADIEFRRIQELMGAYNDTQAEIDRVMADANLSADQRTQQIDVLNGQLANARTAMGTRLGGVQNIIDGFVGAPIENVQAMQRRLTERQVAGSRSLYNTERDLTVAEIADQEALRGNDALLAVRGTFQQQQYRRVGAADPATAGQAAQQAQNQGPNPNPVNPPGGRAGGTP